MKVTQKDITDGRLARLAQDKVSLAKQIAHLKQAQEEALLKAQKVKFEFQEEKRRRFL